MAYHEDYRSSDQAPYSDPQDYPTSSSSYNRQPAPYANLPNEPSRDSSNARSDSPQQGQPVYDAVSNAFVKSDAASQLDPNLVAQITEQVRKQVIDSLKLSGHLPARTQAPSSQPYAQPSSGETATAFPPRDVYTPPSPTRHESIHSTGGSNSPDIPAQDPYFDDIAREREGSTPRYSTKRAASPPSASDHGSQYGSASQYSVQSPPPQARPQFERHLTEVEETAIEKTWQPLFDSDGQPTARLGQFLRGLAIHLINDYEPKQSIVVTPVKMRKFYEDVLCQDENYPWSKIFGTLSHGTISKMYRDLRCQHHFVQDDLDRMPHIPALTPAGFQVWMTLMIQAHPQLEFERLSKAVKSMPISNADDQRERFPKELSRRLFPKMENLQARQRCAAALSADGQIPIRSCSFPPPPPPAQPPYPHQPEASAVASEDSDNEPATAIPIERERKPYTAREGCGRVYEGLSTSKASGPSSNPDTFGATRSHRSQSNVSAGANPYRSMPNTSTGEYPPSTTQTRHHRMSSNIPSSSRRRSPSFSNAGGHDRYGSHSEPNVADIPSSYYASNIYSGPGDDDQNGARARFAKDAEARRNDWARRQAEEESGGASRGYMPGTQSRHGSIYDDEYYRGRAGYGNQGAYGGYPPPPPRY